MLNMQLKIINHLPAMELEKAIVEASFVISRCGYSTVMDLMELRKKSILIPTPGQTEQEYLAVHLMQQQYALCINQAHFYLSEALHRASSFTYRNFTHHSSVEIQEHIGKRDYVFSMQGIVLLSDELKRKFIDLLSSILDRKRDPDY